MGGDETWIYEHGKLVNRVYAKDGPEKFIEVALASGDVSAGIRVTADIPELIAELQAAQEWLEGKR